MAGSWAFRTAITRVLRDGVLVYEDDRILYVGPSFAGAVDAVIPAAGKLVAPGLVNIHALANIDVQTLVLDTSEEGLASSEAYAVTGDPSPELQEDQLRVSARFSLLQLLKGGSTTIVEISTMAPSRFETPRREAPLLVEAAAEVGARLYVSHKFRGASATWRLMGPTATTGTRPLRRPHWRMPRKSWRAMKARRAIASAP